MGTLYSHPGYNKYDLFCQAAAKTIADDKNPIALLANLISDDEDKEERNTEPQIGPPPITIPKIGQWSQRTIIEQTPEKTRVNSTSVQSQRVLQLITYLP